MTALPTARNLIYAPPTSGGAEPAPELPGPEISGPQFSGPQFSGIVTLTPRDRTVRIREFETDAGERFVADFPERTRLDNALGFVLDDGRIFQIRFVEAELIEVRGDLVRIAWHIGALRMPCQVESDHLVTFLNDELEQYLRQMGAEVTRSRGSFFPEILNDKIAMPAPGQGLAMPLPRQITPPQPPAPDTAPEPQNSDGPF
jgi:urease accessory protein